jgi:hypothetical protein
MAIRKRVEETLVVDGAREAWLTRSRTALELRGFTKIEVSEALFQVRANYKKFTTWGDIQISLLPSGDAATAVQVAATANVDNVFALFKSPGRKIVDEFKAGLDSVTAAASMATTARAPEEQASRREQDG